MAIGLFPSELFIPIHLSDPDLADYITRQYGQLTWKDVFDRAITSAVEIVRLLKQGYTARRTSEGEVVMYPPGYAPPPPTETPSWAWALLGFAAGAILLFALRQRPGQ